MGEILYLKDKKLNKYLPWQYYDLFNFISIPMLKKRPYIKKWQLFTKTVHARNVNENIGILTGKVSGITVVDIDIKDNGLLFWKNIAQPEIITPTVVTSTGGLHLYFKYEPTLDNTIKLVINGTKIGIDIRNDHGLVLAPPSKISNKKYKWIKGLSLEDTSIKKMPVWLYNLIKETQKK